MTAGHNLLEQKANLLTSKQDGPGRNSAAVVVSPGCNSIASA